jgi:predicted RNA-binding protein (virulence factor B family)
VAKLGDFHTLEVISEDPSGLLLGDERILLPRRNVPKGCAVGDRVRVFLYADPQGRAVATTREPALRPGEFAFLKVVHRMEHGVFMDWGLEKDLFVPNHEQIQHMRVGQRYVVGLTIDAQDRVMGSNRIGNLLDGDVFELEVGQRVKLMVYERHERGLKVIVDGRYPGMIYDSDVYQDIGIGDQLEGAIATIREDGKLDIRLRETGLAAMSQDAESVLAALKRSGGYLPLNDKSDPRAIRSQLEMSKKAFKRAVGILFKAEQLEIEADGIRLLEV